MAVGLGRLGQAGADAQDIVVRCGHPADPLAEEIAQLPLDPVADDGVADLARDGETEPRIAVPSSRSNQYSVRKRVDTDRPRR